MKIKNVLIVAMVLLVSILPVFLAFQEEPIGSRVDAFVGVAFVFMMHMPLQIFCSIYGGRHLKELWFLPLIPPCVALLLDELWTNHIDSWLLLILLGTALFVGIMLITAWLTNRSGTKKQERQIPPPPPPMY